MSNLHAQFKNINGSDTYPLDEVIYPLKGRWLVYSKCNNDYDALQALSMPEEWKALFAKRKERYNLLTNLAFVAKRSCSPKPLTRKTSSLGRK